jgi:carbon-monoxide dehydrogenase medium subunit
LHPFAYEAPTSIDDAVAVLDKHGDRARPIAGGTDVLVQARANRWDLDAIVDVKNIPELTDISHYPDGSVAIGAATACYEIYEDETIRANFPGIIDAVEMIGGIQIQSRASLGGNLCNSSPSADGICPLIAYNAVCHIAGPGGEDHHRDVAVEDFCTGPGSNVLGRGEILVSLVLPNPGSNFGAAYERFIPRNEMDIAVAGAGVSVKLNAAGNMFEAARVALAAVAPVPLVVPAAEEALVGNAVSDDVIEAAAKIAGDAASPISDMRGTIEQRKHLSAVLTRRMINKSVERARG